MARLLIIEDNAANLNLMSYLLTTFGHVVEGCRDGQSGLDAARRLPPDLVLCDIQLPKISGYAIAQALRAEPAFQDLPLVAVSALAMRGDSEKALSAGFSGYIEKPVEPETFVSRVESFLPPALRKGGPRQPSMHEPAPVPEPRRHDGPQRTVLAVDDVPANLNLMQVIFQGAGYRVLTATSIQHALEQLRRESVDLVISDVHMPSGDGFTFRRTAAAEPALAGIPFMFVSSTVMRDEDRLEAAQLGVRDLIERPIEPQALLEAVQACLRRQVAPK